MYWPMSKIWLPIRTQTSDGPRTELRLVNYDPDFMRINRGNDTKKKTQKKAVRAARGHIDNRDPPGLC